MTAPMRHATPPASRSSSRPPGLAHARLAVAILALIGVTACAGRAPVRAGPAARRQPATAPFAATHVYTAFDGDVPNPERGFSKPFWPLGAGRAHAPLDDRVLAAVRADGLTVVHLQLVIDEFVSAPLSPDALAAVDAAFAAVRRAGLKAIPRFAYNMPTLADFREAADAPLARVLAHLDQLAPVLSANADVIAVLEAGFVGAWGEWHSSSNGLVQPDRRLAPAAATILARLLAVLPQTRMVALRNPFHKQQIFGRTPLSADDAFSGSPRARVGAHNDCFGSGPAHGGTFAPPPGWPQSTAALKAFVSRDNRFVPQGGESCGADGDAAAFAGPDLHCPSALAALAEMRWSTMNLDYHPDVIALWRQEGCLDEIRRRLGYRLRMLDARLDGQGVAGRPWPLALRLTNDGYAAPFNPRRLEVVLRHTGTGQVLRIPVAADPRFWGPGETYLLRVEPVLPPDLAPGDYEVLLHLPDPERGLYGVPAYSIRLANDGLWEADTGFNRLLARVTVVPGAAAVPARRASPTP
jgi:hypothetical protein